MLTGERMRGGDLIIEGYEKRVWAVQTAEGTVKAGVIPEAFKDLLGPTRAFEG